MRRSRALSIFLVLFSLALSDCGSSGPSRPTGRPSSDTGQDAGATADAAPELDVVTPREDVPKPQDTPKPPPDVAADGTPDSAPEVAPDAADDGAADSADGIEVVEADVADVVDVGPDAPPPEDIVPEDIAQTPVCFADIECAGWEVEHGQCEQLYCDRSISRCRVRPAVTPIPCDDGDICTHDDVCFGEICQGTAPSCSDDDACNGEETCDPETGECVAGEPVDCGAGDRCKRWTCDPTIGCIDSGEPVVCSDDDCFGRELCDRNQGCVRYTDPLCPVDDPCRGTLIGCDEDIAATGNYRDGCFYVDTPECDDDDVCNGVFACEQTAEDPTATVCVEITPALGCDDGDVCNGREACDPETGCFVDVPPLDCDADDDPCNGIERCDAELGRCVVEEACADTDDDPCNGTRECVGANAPDDPICEDIPPVECEDDGDICTGILVCDAQTGSCIIDPENGPIDCSDGDPCNGAETCNPIDGSCAPGPPPEPCDDGNPCNGIENCTTGVGCEVTFPPIECEDGNACNGVLVCDPTTGGCVQDPDRPPLECDDSDRCNGVEICDEAIGCTIDPLQGPINCSNGNLCDGEEECQPLTGQCRPAPTPLDCDDHNDCTRDVCHTTAGCQHTTYNDGTPCDDLDDCTLDDVCAAGECVASHAGCLCPADDDREPDGSSSEATFHDPPRHVAYEAIYDGVLCGADEDWTRVTALEGDRLDATLEHDAAYGDLDLRFEDETGTLLAVSTGDGDVETISFHVTTDGPILVIVSGAGGAGFENSYTLTLFTVPAGVCLEDDHEDNDTLGTATDLPVGVPVAGRICAGDPDVFVGALAAGATGTFDLVYGPREAPVTMEVLDANGNVVDLGSGVPGRQRIEVPATVDTDVGIRLTVVDGSEAEYALTFRSYSGDDCVNDFYESNDTQSTAVPVQWGAVIDANLCPLERDWYSMQLGPGDEIQIDLVGSPIESNLNVYLHQPVVPPASQGGFVIFGSSPTGEEHVSYTMPESAASGVWGIRVVGIGDASASYLLTITGTGGGVTCQDDLFEQNDQPGVGTTLRDGQNLAAKICADDPDWFRVVLSAGDVLNADLLFTHADGDLDLVVRDPAGEEVGGAASQDDNETLMFEAPADGTYALGVVAAPGTENDYRLQVSIDFVVPPCTDDAFEENDAPGAATALAVDDVLDGTSCPGDDDWFAFTASATETYTVALANAAGLSCVLTDEAGDTVAVCVAGDQGTGAMLSGHSGLVRVLVPGTATATANYTLSLTSQPSFTCEDDGLEDDDEYVQATVLANPDSIGGNRCPDDDDWFAIDLAADEVLTATLTIGDAQGDLDLVLWDAAGARLIHNESEEPFESITFLAPTAGTFGLQVTDDAGGWGSYTLDVSVDAFLCGDDPFEPNESQAEALLLTAPDGVNGQLCTDDVDWFAVAVEAGETIVVDLRFFPEKGDLNLYLHRPDGQTVATSVSVDQSESIRYTAQIAGEYGIRVFGVSGAENVYRLEVQVEPFVPPCEDDVWEPNDAIGFAPGIAIPEPERTATISLQLCEGNEDWFGVDVAAGDLLSVSVAYGPGGGDLWIQSHDPDGAVLQTILGTAGSGELELRATVSARYYLRVYGTTAETRVAYDMTVTLSTPYACAEDGLEENDDSGSATPITAGTPVGARLCPADEDWFQIDAAPRDVLTVDLRFVHAVANLDLSLVGPAGTLVATATSTDDDEHLVFPVVEGGTYWIQVWSPSAETVDVGYQLEVAHAVYVCEEDPFEDNDSVLDPAPLTNGTSVNASLCGGEDDWFAVALGGGEGLTVTLTYDAAWGDPEVAIVSWNRVAVLASAQALNGTLTLDATADVTGTYFIHVWATADVDNEYSLRTAVTAYACTNDSLEPSTQANPAALPASGIVSDGRICVGEEDWYRFTVAPGETPILSLSFVHADGDLALQLIRPDRSVAATSDSESDFESGSAQALAGGEWIARVYSNVPGTENTYELAVSVLPYECVDDAYEENDSRAAAAALTSGATVDGLVCIGDDDWFAVTLETCETLTAAMTYPYAPDADLQLALYMADGTKVRESRSPTGTENVVYRAPIGGVYYVRVYAEVGAESSYSLSVSVEAYSCADDPYEDNDDLGGAWPISVIDSATPGGNHCCNDDDWFAVDVTAGDRLTATLCYDTPSGDLNVSFHAPDGTVMASSATDKADHVAFVAQADGTVNVAVTAAGGVENDYILWLTREPYTCTDDGWEQNDEAGSATVLSLPSGGQATITDAVLCSADDDWYEVSLTAGDSFGVAVQFTQPESCPVPSDTPPGLAGHDLNVSVIDPSGSVIARGESTTSDETLEVFAPRSGSYQILVASPVFADQTYSATLSRAPFVCTEDGYEQNDTFSMARAISPAGDAITAYYCNDEDWFWFNAAVGDTIDVSLGFYQAIGDLDLELFDPTGTVAATSTSATDDEAIHHVSVRTGVYRVHVKAAPFVENRYTLDVDVAAFVCVDDALEENDTQVQGPVVANGQTVAAQICPDDVDWFTVLLNAGDELTVDLTFTHQLGDLNLALYRPDGVELAVSETTTDDEQIVHEAPAPGAYGVRVTGTQSSHNDYDLAITVRDASACVDDAYEENDSQLDAVTVLPDTTYDLRMCPADEDWFEIDLAPSDQLTVDLLFAQSDGDLDVQLIGPSGVVATGQTHTDNEQIVYEAAEAGLYRIRAYGDGPAISASYTLLVTVVGAGPGCVEDGFEENDSRAAGWSVEPNIVFDAQVCGVDDDWYRLDLSAAGGPQAIDVGLTYLAGNGALNIILYDGASPLDEAQTAPGTPTVHTFADLVLPGVYDFVVSQPVGSRSTYRITPNAGDWACNEEDGEAAEEPKSGCFGQADCDSALGTPPDSLCAGDFFCHGIRDFPGGQGLIGGAVCAGDADVFAIPIAALEDLTIELAFDQYDADGVAPHYSNLKIKLHRPDGVLLQQNINTSNLKRIIRRDLAAGTYYLQVYGDPVSSNLYTLQVSIAP